MATQMSSEVEEALAELDSASEKVAGALQRCAQLVGEGKLSGDAVMLKVHELAARLMNP